MLYATQVIPLIPLTYALIHYFFLLSFLENCRLFSKTKAINAAFLAKLRGLPTLCFPRYICSWRNVYRFSLDFYITQGCGNTIEMVSFRKVFLLSLLLLFCFIIFVNGDFLCSHFIRELFSGDALIYYICCISLALILMKFVNKDLQKENVWRMTPTTVSLIYCDLE